GFQCHLGGFVAINGIGLRHGAVFGFVFFDELFAFARLILGKHAAKSYISTTVSIFGTGGFDEGVFHTAVGNHQLAGQTGGDHIFADLPPLGLRRAAEINQIGLESLDAGHFGTKFLGVGVDAVVAEHFDFEIAAALLEHFSKAFAVDGI